MSAALTSASVENLALVMLGDEGGEEFTSGLVKRKIVFDYASASGRIRENLTHISQVGETRLSFGGLTANADALSLMEGKIFSYLSEGDAFVFSGSLPDGVSKDWAISLVKRVGERGIFTVLDSRNFTEEDIIKAKPSMIKPNLLELGKLSGGEITSLAAVDKYLMHLLDKGVSRVLLSLGGDGARLASGDKIYSCNAPKIAPVSTVGAGDSAIGGFLYGLSKGLTDGECLRYAVSFGSAACLEEGTEAPSWENISAIFPSTYAETV